MLELFVPLGIIIGLLWGINEMLRSDSKLGEASVAMLPVGAFFGGLAGSVVTIVLGLIIWFLTTYWLPILGVCIFATAVIYAVAFPDQMKYFYAAITDYCKALVSRMKMSDRTIMRYAIKQTKKLKRIAPDFEWLDIRTSISELGTLHIPSLLRERKGLQSAIKRVYGVLRQVGLQKADRQSFEKANARRTAQTVEELVVKLQKNEVDIAEALDTLRHLEADLAIATVDTYKRDEIKAKLSGLVSRIQSNSAAVQEARTEVDDQTHQRSRRLTE